MNKHHESTSKRRASAHSNSHKKQAESSPITPKFIFESIRRWWLVALPVGLVLAAVSSFLISHFFEPVYESRAMLRIRTNPAYLLAPEIMGEPENYVQNELAILRSPPVLEQVVTKTESANIPELAKSGRDEQIRALNRLIRVDSIEGSELHYVYVTTHDPVDSKLICETLVSEYIDAHEEDEAATLDNLIAQVELQAEGYREEVAKLQSKLRDQISANERYLKDLASSDSGVSKEEILLQTPITDLRAARELKRIDRETKVQDIKRLEAKIEAQPIVEPADYEVEAAVQNSTQLVPIRSAIETLLSDIASSRWGPDHPENLRLKEALAGRRVQLEDATKRVEAELRLQLEAQKTDERQQLLEQYRDDLARIDHELVSFDKAIESHVGEVEEDNARDIEIEFTLQELQDARELRDQFLSRVTILRTEKLRPNQVMTANLGEGGKATLPKAPVEKHPIRQMSLASLASILFPFVIAFLWELRVRRVSTAEQVTDHSRVPIVGEVAALPARRGPSRNSRRLDRQMKLFEESVDTLRTSFFLTLKSDECQVISITSAVANEGKTTVASQLALSTSRASDKRVLLIDADLRAPDIHRVYGIENDLGLVDVLRGDCEPDEAIAASWEDNLFILPGGRLRGESPHQLVSGGKFDEVIAKLRSQFDVIIVDTSPVLSSSESLLMNQAADHTLVSVMRDVSRVEQVKKLAERMQLAGVHVAGCIMNGVSHSRYAYSYGVYEAADS